MGCYRSGEKQACFLDVDTRQKYALSSLARPNNQALAEAKLPPPPS